MTSFLRFAPFALASLVLPVAVWAVNPPPNPSCEDAKYAEENECECKNPKPCHCKKEGDEGSGSGCGCEGEPSNASLGYRLHFGGIPFEPGLDDGIIVIHQQQPTPTQFTPQVVKYASVLAVQVASKKTNTADWEIVILNDSGRMSSFQFPSGQSVAYTSAKKYALRLLAADRSPVQAGTAQSQPAFLRLEYEEGGWTELDFTTGKPVKHQAPSGRLTDLGSMPEALVTRIIQADGVTRQIKTAAGLADFVQTDEQAFEIHFYAPSQIGAFDTASGLYAFTGTSFRVIRLENASDSLTEYGHVKISEVWGTRNTEFFFIYNPDLDEWSLTRGNQGAQRTEVKESAPGPGTNETTITRTLKNEAEAVVSTRQTVKRKFAWGSSTVREIQEPATLNLITTQTYHETSGQPGYSKVKSRQEPDGSWASYVYDADGRVIETSTPWKNSALQYPLTAPRRIVANSYTSLDGDDVTGVLDTKPRTITTSVVTSQGGAPVVIDRTWHVYKTDAQGVYTEITERAANNTAVYGDSGNLRTTSVYYTTNTAQSGYDALSAGRLHYEDRENGTRITSTYSRDAGDLNAYFTITEILGTPSAPAGLDGLSTRTDKIHDVRGKLVETKSSIRSGGQWHPVSTETRTVNGQGFHVATHVDARQTYAAAYNAHLLVSQTTEDGVTTTYIHDALDKVSSETRVGIAVSGAYVAQPDITTTYMRELGGLDCGCDGEVTAFITAGSLALETKEKKDATGRLTYQKDAAGLETTYAYALGGRQTIRTHPNGGTFIDLHHADGRHESHTGTGGIAEYYDYGVNIDGSTWTKTTQVSQTGERWEKTTENLLGQFVKVERPAYDGGILTTTYAYDAQGRGVRVRQHHLSGTTETTLMADTLTEYDALGNVTRTGLDVNASGVLDLASSDRITEMETTFAEYDSTWWQVRQAQVYPTTGSATAVQVSESRNRLSGLTGNLAAEHVSLGVEGNLTRQIRQIDFVEKLVTTTTTYPDSTLSAVSITRNGLLVSETGKTSTAATTYGYDALGRVTSIKDPRHTEAATMAYHATTGQLTSQTDAAGHAITYAYYANGEIGAGQVKLVTDAQGHTRRSGYDLLGRPVHEWGAATYPQAYAYTAHSELATLTTWRDIGVANLDAATWPAPGGGDTTTWTHQATTGLLTRKHYADGKGTDYTYDQLNRLATRTWSRLVAGSPLVTTYGYVLATGELTSVDYSDTTPDVVTTYDRLGRQAGVTDVTGTRTFTYTTALRLDQEQLPSFYGSRILTRSYQGTNTGQVSGRTDGFELGVSGDLDQDYSVVYGYDNAGRLNTVTDSGGTFTYGYLANSNLRSTVTGPVHVATTTYEANRDVIDIVENKVGATSISKYAYTVNNLGQRTQRANTGTAFGTVSTDVFNYNANAEVIGSTNATLTARDQSFAYDPIGNRLSFTQASGTISYTANSLNQYSSISAPFVPSVVNPAYDLDGNQIDTGSGQLYTWDAENRLIAIEPLVPTTGDNKQLNAYDAQSRRVRKQVSTYADGTWSLTTDEKFVYDGWNLVAVLDAASSNSLLRTYTWGTDLSGGLQGAGGVGGLLSAKDGGSVYHYTYDANGNVSEVLNNSGGIAAHYEYDSFGNMVTSIGAYAAANAYRFSTKLLDDVGDLYYYGYRYYSSVTGRWLSRDPIGEKGGANLYSMVRNSGINTWDFLGLCTVGERRNWNVLRAERTVDGQFGQDFADEIAKAGGLLSGVLILSGAAPLAAPVGSGAPHLAGEIVLAGATTVGGTARGLPDQATAIDALPAIIRHQIQTFNFALSQSRQITVEGAWEECESFLIFCTKWTGKKGAYTYRSSSALTGADFSTAISAAKASLYGE